MTTARDDGHLRYLITAYLFDNLSADGRAEVEAHLAGCEECRDELQALRATRALIEDALAEGAGGETAAAGAEGGAAPYSFEAHRLERVLAAGLARPRGVIRRIGYAAAAVLLFGAIVAFLLPNIFTARQGRARLAGSSESAPSNRAEVVLDAASGSDLEAKPEGRIGRFAADDGGGAGGAAPAEYGYRREAVPPPASTPAPSPARPAGDPMQGGASTDDRSVLIASAVRPQLRVAHIESTSEVSKSKELSDSIANKSIDELAAAAVEGDRSFSAGMRLNQYDQPNATADHKSDADRAGRDLSREEAVRLAQRARLDQAEQFDSDAGGAERRKEPGAGSQKGQDASGRLVENAAKLMAPEVIAPAGRGVDLAWRETGGRDAVEGEVERKAEDSLEAARNEEEKESSRRGLESLKKDVEAQDKRAAVAMKRLPEASNFEGQDRGAIEVDGSLPPTPEDGHRSALETISPEGTMFYGFDASREPQSPADLPVIALDRQKFSAGLPVANARTSVIRDFPGPPLTEYSLSVPTPPVGGTVPGDPGIAGGASGPASGLYAWSIPESTTGTRFQAPVEVILEDTTFIPTPSPELAPLDSVHIEAYEVDLGEKLPAFRQPTAGEPVHQELGLERADEERTLRAFDHYRRNDAALDLESFAARRLPVPAPVIGDEGLGQEGFRARYGVNPFVATERDRFSTFAMDVDTASYTRARTILAEGRLPEPAQVRTEEFVNAFPDPRVADPSRAFSVFCEGGPSPFGGARGSETVVEQVQITVKARDLAPGERRPAILTFAIDTSGSMEIESRLDLVRSALSVLLDSLAPDDRVAIVAYGTQAYLVLPHTPARERARIAGALDSLAPLGATNVEAGLDLAYRLADEVAHARAASRVILCSDGVATSGERDAEALLRKVRVYADRGIYLSVVGFGRERYDDAFLEQVANRGNGQYGYVSSTEDAVRLFSDNLPAALSVLARDAKIQVDFDPAVVRQYRLLGYENRDVKDEDFRNDAIDAGEVGPGSTVTAIYEVVRRPASAGDLGRVHLRYHDTSLGRVEEIDFPIPPGVIATRLEGTSERFRLLSSVAECAELLRESYFARDGSFSAVLATLATLDAATAARPEVREFIDMTLRAREIALARWAAE